MATTDNRFANHDTDVLVGYVRDIACSSATPRLDDKNKLLAAAKRLEALYHAEPDARSSAGVSAGVIEKTGWKCKVCGECGTIVVGDSVSVYDAVNLLSSAHRAANAQCTDDLSNLTIWPIVRTVR